MTRLLHEQTQFPDGLMQIERDKMTRASRRRNYTERWEECFYAWLISLSIASNLLSNSEIKWRQLRYYLILALGSLTFACCVSVCILMCDINKWERDQWQRRHVGFFSVLLNMHKEFRPLKEGSSLPPMMRLGGRALVLNKTHFHDVTSKWFVQAPSAS